MMLQSGGMSCLRQRENSKDDIWGSLGSLRTFMAVQHKEYLNQMLMADVAGPAAVATANYTGSQNWETLDRIISSKAEQDVLGGPRDDWYDVWDTLDRDTQTKYDSVVESAGGTINVKGNLTKSLIITTMRKVMKSGGKHPNVCLLYTSPSPRD